MEYADEGHDFEQGDRVIDTVTEAPGVMVDDADGAVKFDGADSISVGIDPNGLLPEDDFESQKVPTAAIGYNVLGADLNPGDPVKWNDNAEDIVEEQDVETEHEPGTEDAPGTGSCHRS